MSSSQEATRSSNMPLIISAIAFTVLTVLLALFVPGNWWQVVILGVVEGVTEFLPISSTGHLLITSKLLGFEGSIGGTFEIFIQLGAILAVIGYYFRDLWTQLTTVQRDPSVQRLWIGILIAFLPIGLIAFFLRDWIKTVLFESPTVIAWALIVGGIVFLVVEYMPKRATTTHSVGDISLMQAFLIGLSQIFALVPGVSRSGSTIVGALLLGLDRRTATAFSFYLSIPVLGAATVVDLLGSLDLITTDDIARLLLGTVVALIAAWISIGWLLRFVSRNSFVPFGIYRIIVGVVILVLVGMGVV